MAHPRSESPKECTKCGETKPALDFYSLPNNRDGLHGRCKPCHNYRYPRSELPKECIGCKEVKPALDFHPSATSRDGLIRRCKSCHNYRYPRSELPKECSECKQVKPALDFAATPSLRDGLEGRCRPCYALNERYRKYRLSQDDYTAMLEAQGGACAICSDQFTDKLVACVDHDHNCCPGGKSCGACVRGLLCGPCNTGIGMLKDDLQLVRRAALYMERREVASV